MAVRNLSQKSKRLIPVIAAMFSALLLTGSTAPAFAVDANLGFELDSNSDGVADCWTVSSIGTARGTASVISNGHTGRAQQFTATKVPTKTAWALYQQPECMLPATAGGSAGATIWYTANGPADFRMQAKLSNGNWYTLSPIVSLPPTSTFTARSLGVPVLPAGTTSVRVVVRLNGLGTVTVDDVTVTTAGPTTPTDSSILFAPSFAGADGLMTNEWAFWNPTRSEARISDDWEMDSGSLFRKSGTGWTGIPDNRVPDATSSTGTNSAVFRLNTKRRDFGDVKVSMELLNNAMTTTSTTPAVAWDGVHVFLRRQDETNLYYVSVNRRDGHVVIKKKCSGGPSNGGTYYTLADKSGFAIPFGAWQKVAATVKTNTDGSVSVALLQADQPVLSVLDTGTGCAPILTPGGTGVRGDNDDFQFRNFVVTRLP